MQEWKQRREVWNQSQTANRQSVKDQRAKEREEEEQQKQAAQDEYTKHKIGTMGFEQLSEKIDEYPCLLF